PFPDRQSSSASTQNQLWTHVHLNTHTHTHTHTYTHTHTHTLISEYRVSVTLMVTMYLPSDLSNSAHILYIHTHTQTHTQLLCLSSQLSEAVCGFGWWCVDNCMRMPR